MNFFKEYWGYNMRFMGCERCIFGKTKPVKLAIFKSDFKSVSYLIGREVIFGWKKSLKQRTLIRTFIRVKTKHEKFIKHLHTVQN